MADPTYITQNNFYKYCRDVKPVLNSWRPLRAWVVNAGSVYRAEQTGAVEVLFQDGEDLGAPESSLNDVDANGEWFYDSAIDRTYVFNDANDPDNLSMQAGEDFTTYFAEVAEQASRLVDSALSGKRQIPFVKDKSGNYEEIIIQVTCYKLAEIVTPIKAPLLFERYSELLMNEAETGLIDRLNNGKLKLLQDVTAQSDEGKIREVAVAGALRLVETRGRYAGSPWDLLKVICTTGGKIGVAVFKVFGADETAKTMKSKELTPTDGLVVDGQHQGISGSFQILFEGADDAEMTADDEWEIEVRWPHDQTTNPINRSIPIGRGAPGFRPRGCRGSIQEPCV